MTDSAPVVDTPAELGSGARLMRVLRNKQVRKVQFAFMGSTLGDWAFGTAMLVWAYLEGGATAVGGYQAARFVAMAVFAPLGGVLADRMSRKAFMITSDVMRAVLIAAAAVTVGMDGPALAVYALAVVAAIVGAPFRAAQAGLLPQLVDAPEDLTAANAVTGNLESVMMFAGPALAGILIGVWDVESVFWLNTATFLWSLLLLLRVRAGHVVEEPDTDGQAEESGPGAGFCAELAAGFALIVRNRDLRNVSLIAAATGFAWGGLTVYMVLLAINELDAGPEGVGYLNAVLGVATLVGGLVVLGRLKSAHLGQFMVLGTLGWGLPLLLLAAWPSPVTVVAAFVVIGLSDPVGGLGLDTIPQRVAPAEFISRIFGALESALVASMAVGALLAPVLIEELGLRAALSIGGGLLVLVGLTRLPAMRRLDRVLEAPEALEPLRAVPIFADLSPSALEKLAHAAERLRVVRGSTVLAEGDSSDRFYLIVSGAVEVTSSGRVLRTEGPGEFFGEIGLLRDVSRTATVTATQDSEMLVIDRAHFLGAVSNLGDSRTALDELVVRRLSA